MCGSSRSSGGSDDRDALGVDLPDEGLFPDLVFRSRRLEVVDDAEDDCCDCELVIRALEDRLGDGGAIDVEWRGEGERESERWMEDGRGQTRRPKSSMKMHDPTRQTRWQ